MIRHTDTSKVAIVRVKNRQRMQEYIEDAISVLKLDIARGAKIIVKPNLNELQGPQTGVTTDVRTVDALIRFLTNEYCPKRIAVVESDSWCRLADEAFDKLGYRSLGEKHRNVRLVNLSRTRKIKVHLPRPKHFRFLSIPEIFLEYDYYITVPTLRTLFPTRISCALKNQFGIIPSRYKARYHPYLDSIISNLNLLIRPDLCLVDGLVGSDGEPRRTDIVILSNDPVANDTVVARIMGVRPEKIGHLALSESFGTGNMKEIEVFLDGKRTTDLDALIQPFGQPNELLFAANALGCFLVRSGDRLVSVGRSVVSKVVTSAYPFQTYSKSEILKKLVERDAWKSFLTMSKEIDEGQTAS